MNSFERSSSRGTRPLATTAHFRYSSVPGFFLQDDPKTDPLTFDAMTSNFGLVDQKLDTDARLPDKGKNLTQWQRFAFKISTLNKEAIDTESYKLLFIGRHGKGYHNLGKEYYGSNAWDCYYRTLSADPKNASLVWSDSTLTLGGVREACKVRDFWVKLIKEERASAPETYYTSPLERACHTTDIIFKSLSLLSGVSPPVPMVKEPLRERLGIATSDRRSSRDTISERYPHFEIGPTFTENDELWRKDLREPDMAIHTRLQEVLDEVITDNPTATYISLTSHSSAITALLKVIGHRPFPLRTSVVIPVLLRVQKVPGPRPEQPDEPWSHNVKCEGDPLQAGLDGFDSFSDYVKFAESEEL
ncbi:histidine phosphatase superfamily [Leptodontidium sp. MPI-SDFR-AT-0119]|nr:histidine phosphatase superfamily [Leptodontidium sp. MPI-SDFR-AT-0119]